MIAPTNAERRWFRRAGEMVRVMRIRAGLSQRAIEHAHGLAEHRVQVIERGRHRTLSREFVVVCRAVGADIDALG